jgi:hypothetical protein
MDTKARASTRALVAQGASSPLRAACALLTGFFLAACGSSDEGGGGGKKDSGRDTTSTTPIDGPRTGLDTSQQQPDLGTDAPAGCVLGVQIISPGVSAAVPGYCPMCVCRADGTWGNCALCDGGTTSPDNRPGPDSPPAGCVQGGSSYAPGASMPRADRCPGSCICSANGTPTNCTGGCLDSGTVTQPDTADGPRRDVVDAPPPPDVPQPDLPIEYPVDHVDVPPIDTACAYNKPCTLTNGGQGVCTAGACVACSGANADTTCATIYGAGNVCVSGRCVAGECNNSSQCTGGLICNTAGHNCVACNAYSMDAGDPTAASDNRCKADTTYGSGTICLSGACTRGDCHTSTNCNAGRICGSSVPNACGDCATDAQCKADTRYGSGSICVNNLCVTGNCHTTADCTATGGGPSGQICNATTHTCSNCTADTQCAAEFADSARPICVTTAGATNVGRCVPNPTTGAGRLCPATGNAACPANSSDFCCGSPTKCVPGNCCDDTQCTTTENPLCKNNVCSHCEAVTGNNYMVDPANGDDTVATGNITVGTAAAPECAFRTLTKAIDVITSSGTVTPTAGTTITIIVSGTNPLLADTVLPIAVPRNVTITTQGTRGITMSLPAGENGFSFARSPAGLAPIAAAPLTIQGVVSTSGPSGYGIHAERGTGTNTGSIAISNVTISRGGGLGAVEVAGANTSVVLSNLTISNARADGIHIANGTVGMTDVTVDGAGAAGAGDGINVAAGTITINSGVQVTNSAGNGLTLAGGATTINNTSTPATQFDSNGAFGISVPLSTTTTLTLTGAVATSGTSGSVMTQNNGDDNVRFESSAAGSSITGLYSANSAGDGLQILAGSRLKVRSSTILDNRGSGIRIASTGTPADDILGTTTANARIDLGTSPTTTGAVSPGRNTLQTATGASANTGAGLCVDNGVATGTGGTAQNLYAEGNLFAAGATTGTRDCTSNNPVRTLNVGDNCTGAADLGISATLTSNVNVQTDYCVQ